MSSSTLPRVHDRDHNPGRRSAQHQGAGHRHERYRIHSQPVGEKVTDNRRERATIAGAVPAVQHQLSKAAWREVGANHRSRMAAM
jgi:hypothetical protein